MQSLTTIKTAWLGTVKSMEMLVALGYMARVTTLGDLTPQHFRKAPIERILEDTIVRSPLLMNNYVSNPNQIVTPTALVAISALIPLAFQIGLSAFDHPHIAVSAVSARLYSLLYAGGSAIATTDIIKRYCGYYRPYFYEECDFEDTDCTEKPGDASRSFPSGHASISMVFLGHTSLCLLGAARCGVKTTSIDLGNFKILLCLGPFFLALWISASRVKENDHWPADVVAGAIIGGLFASLFYLRYFPFFFDPESHLPRPAFQQQQRSLPTLMPGSGGYEHMNETPLGEPTARSSGGSNGPPNAQELC